MEIKELIESGILESFVLGETTEQENSMVLEMAEKYPEVRAEIDSIESTLHQTVLLGSVKAPDYIRQNFLSQIPQPSRATETLRISSNQNIQRWRFTPMAAAIAALLIASAALNIWLYSKWQANESEITAMRRDNQILAQNASQLQFSNKMMEEKLAMMQNPDYMMVVMKGTPEHPGMLANVYWNKTNGETYLDLKNLPPAPKGKQYQLWAIVDGKPMDAGVFNASAANSGMIKMKDRMGPKVFAVTLEKMGGSENPTMDQMVMVGNFG